MTHADKIIEQLEAAADDDDIPEHIRERVEERIAELEDDED